MKFSRFELLFRYSLTTPQTGDRIKHVSDAFVTETVHLMGAFENSFIYLPVDEREFARAARTLFRSHGLKEPPELAASIPYFINSQLFYIASRAIGHRGWTVEREPRYGIPTRHRADLRIALETDAYTDDDFNPCSIWIETDHARDSGDLYGSSQKVLLALSNPRRQHDLFVQFLYRTRNFDGLEAVADTHWRNLLISQASVGSRISLALAYLTPANLRAHAEIESDLVLFNGAPRVNDCYFQSWTMDGDFAHLNQRTGTRAEAT